METSAEFNDLVDKVTKASAQQVKQAELERLYNLALENKFTIPTKLAPFLCNLVKRKPDGQLLHELEDRCEPLPGVGEFKDRKLEAMTIVKAKIKRRGRLDELCVEIPVKLIAMAVKMADSKCLLVKCPALASDWIQLIFTKNLISVCTKQLALDVIVQLTKETSFKLTELQAADMLNNYLGSISSDVGAEGLKYAVSLFELVCEQIISKPELFKALDIFEKIPSEHLEVQQDLTDSLVKELALSLDRNGNQNMLVSDKVLLQIIDNSKNVEQQKYISRIVAYTFLSRDDIGEDVLENLDEVEFTSELLRAIASTEHLRSKLHDLTIKAILTRVSPAKDNSLNLIQVVKIFSSALVQQKLNKLVQMVEFALEVLLCANLDDNVSSEAIIFLENATESDSNNLFVRIKELLALETNLKDSGRYEKMVERLKRDMATYVENRGKLTPRCFKFLFDQINYGDQIMALDILRKLIENDLQALPDRFLSDLCNAIPEDDRLIEILDKLMQQRKSLSLQKATQLCLSMLKKRISENGNILKSFAARCLMYNLDSDESFDQIEEFVEFIDQRTVLALVKNCQKLSSTVVKCLEQIAKKPFNLENYITAVTDLAKLDRSVIDGQVRKLLDFEFNSTSKISESMKKAINLSNGKLVPFCFLNAIIAQLCNGSLQFEDEMYVFAWLKTLESLPSSIICGLMDAVKAGNRHVATFLTCAVKTEPGKLGKHLRAVNQLLKNQQCDERLKDSKQMKQALEEFLQQTKVNGSLPVDILVHLAQILGNIDCSDEIAALILGILFNISNRQNIVDFFNLDNLCQFSKTIQLELLSLYNSALVLANSALPEKSVKQLELLLVDQNCSEFVAVQIIRLLQYVPNMEMLQEKTLQCLLELANLPNQLETVNASIALLTSYLIEVADCQNDELVTKVVLNLQKLATEGYNVRAYDALRLLTEKGVAISEQCFADLLNAFVHNNAISSLKNELIAKFQLIRSMKRKFAILCFLKGATSLYPEIIRKLDAELWIVQFCIQDLVRPSLRLNDELGVSLFYEQFETFKTHYKNQPHAVELILLAIRNSALQQKSFKLTEVANSLEYAQSDSGDFKSVISCFNEENALAWRYKLRSLWIEESKLFNMDKNDVSSIALLLTLIGWSKYLACQVFLALPTEVAELKKLMSFCVRNQVSDLWMSEALRNAKDKMQLFLGSKLVQQAAGKIVPTKRIPQRLGDLVIQGKCSFEILDRLLRSLQESSNELISIHFDRSLSIIEEYSIDSDIINSVFSQFCFSDSLFWEKHIHAAAVKATFQGGKERDLDELVRLIAEKADFKFDNLKKRFLQVRENLQSSGISKWNRSKIESWALSLKQKPKAEIACNLTEIEMIAVVWRAVLLHNKFSPRTVQVLSLLCLLNADTKGRLAQINTGEGKSTIVAMFAVIKALQGHKVDVVTTSTELSIPEVKKQSGFYAMFGLTVGENSNLSCDSQKDKKAIYQRDVVYGTVGDFQGDILRSEFLRREIRGDRPFDVVIVDEVDSMLIDGRSHCVQLSSLMPAMNHLELPLAVVWNYVDSLKQHIVTGLPGIEDKIVMITEDFKIENGQLEINSGVDMDECLVEIEDKDVRNFIRLRTRQHVSQLLRHLSDDEQREYDEFKALEYKCIQLQDEWTTIRDEQLSGLKKEDYKTEDAFRKRYQEEANELEKHGKKVQLQSIRDNEMPKLAWVVNERYPVLAIPKHLEEFARQQMNHWIDNAIVAKYSYRRGQHYDVQNNKIVPIDYSNTGVLQDNMVWSDGLCQFLQLEEGLKMTPENLSTNFISNVEFFKRYKTNIFGLTGTLGSKESQQLLADVYQVDVCVVPAYKQNEVAANEHSKYICKELPAIVVNSSESDWLEKIAETCLAKTRCSRAVLIICKFVKQVEDLHKLLLSKTHETEHSKLFTYTGHGNFKKKSIDVGEMIIATNIAGRGTDIKTSDEVERNGGMHVCVTFLPDNLRVELQNVGRTSREGHNGTAQLVIFETVVPAPQPPMSISSLREVRNEDEAKGIAKARQDVDRMLLKDALFARFCRLEEELLPYDAKNPDEFRYERNALEELWAIWLRVIAEKINESSSETDRNGILSLFDSFAEKMRDFKRHDCIVQNPYYFVLKGVQCAEKKQFEEAIELFEKAILFDPTFCLYARFNKAGAIMNNNKHSDGQRQAREELLKAKQLLKQQFNPDLMSFHTLVSINQAKSPSLVSLQVQHQMNILGQLEQYIDSALDCIEKTLGKNWDVKVEYVTLDKAFQGTETDHGDEIREAEANGFVYVYQVFEKKPTPWWSIIACACIGLAQIIAGGALIVFSCGAAASIGWGLISEGVSDLIIAAKSAYHGDFSWEAWGIQKAISLAISVVTAGIGAIKAAAKATGTFVKTAALKVTALVSVGANAVSQFTKEGLKLAAKQVGLAIAKGVAKEVIGTLTNYVLDKTVLAALESKIEDAVEKSITEMLQNNEWAMKAIEIDLKTNSNYWQNLLIKEGLALMNPNNSGWNEAFGHLQTFAKGVASAHGAGTIVKAFDMGLALAKVATLTNVFKAQFESKLNGFSDEIVKSQNNLRSTSANNNQNLSSGDRREVNNDNVVHHSEPVKTVYEDGDVDVVDARSRSAYSSKQEPKLPELSAQFYKPSNLDNVTSTFCMSVTTKLMATIKGGLVQPATSSLISMGVESMAAGYQKKLNDDTDKFRDKRMVVNMNNEIATSKKDNSVEPTKLSKNVQKSEQSSEHVDQMVKDVATDGEGGLQHFGAAAKVTGRPIEAYDEKGNRITTVGGELGGDPIKVEYIPPSGEDGKQGHWRLISDGEQVASGENSCFFDCIAGSMPGDVNGQQVRQMIASEICEHKEAYRQMAPAIDNLRRDGAETLLMGGAYYADKHGNEVKDADGNRVTDYKAVRKLLEERGQNPDECTIEPEEKDIDNFQKSISGGRKRGPETYVEVFKEESEKLNMEAMKERGLSRGDILNPPPPAPDGSNLPIDYNAEHFDQFYTDHHILSNNNLIKMSGTDDIKQWREFLNEPQNASAINENNLLHRGETATKESLQFGGVMHALLSNNPHLMSVGATVSHDDRSFRRAGDPGSSGDGIDWDVLNVQTDEYQRHFQEKIIPNGVKVFEYDANGNVKKNKKGEDVFYWQYRFEDVHNLPRAQPGLYQQRITNTKTGDKRYFLNGPLPKRKS